MTHNQHYNFYICSCTPDGGLCLCSVDSNGTILQKDFVSLDSPMYAVESEGKLYVLLRAPFENSSESGLISFDIDNGGKLINPSEIVSTNGEVACHLCVDNKNVYIANYISGSVSKIGSVVVGHIGSGPNLPRQDGPHVHYVGLTPDGKYLLVSDLGLDSIFVYDKELSFVNSARVPDGHGARHLVFSEDGKYCFVANELVSTVSAFEYNVGKLTLIDTARCIPEEFEGDSTAAAIRYLDGRVYVSNRGHNSIAVLDFEDEKLSMSETFSCGGAGPRDFDFVGEFIVSTNQDSDNVTVMKNGKVVSEISVKKPICITKT